MVSISFNQSRRKRKSQRSCSPQMVHIVFVLAYSVLFFMLSIVIVMTCSLIKSSSSFTKTTDTSKNDHQHKRENRLRLQSDTYSHSSLLSCPDHSLITIYGCVIQPVELTKEVRLEVQKLRTVQQQTSKEKNVPKAGNNKKIIQDSQKHHYGNAYNAAMSQKGKDHVQNQDRGIIISPFRIIDSSSSSSLSSPQIIISDNDRHNFLIGIFDGHGDKGHDVAQYLQDHVPERISNKIYQKIMKENEYIQINDDIDEKDIVQILKDTFVEIDKELPNDLGTMGGSTASIILRLGDKLYFSNVGDSLSFLAKYDDSSTDTIRTTSNEAAVAAERSFPSSPTATTATIIHKNRFDKAYIEEEKERITKLGGKVFIPPHPENARVVAYDERSKEMVSLGMSRAIGDWYHGKVGVIAEPIVDVIHLKEVQEKITKGGLFVVSSSDGLYDHRRKEFVANHFGKCFHGKLQDGNCHAVMESVNLIDLATPTRKNGYHDDITVLVMKVEF